MRKDLVEAISRRDRFDHAGEDGRGLSRLLAGSIEPCINATLEDGVTARLFF